MHYIIEINYLLRRRERTERQAYLRFSSSVQTWSHWAGSPEIWAELKRAPTTAGILVRCLRSQSFFNTPTGGADIDVLSLWAFANREILEKSGNARVWIGGCSVWRCVRIEAWRSEQPTRETSATGGVRSSSGYSSIVERGGRDRRGCDRRLGNWVGEIISERVIDDLWTSQPGLKEVISLACGSIGLIRNFRPVHGEYISFR